MITTCGSCLSKYQVNMSGVKGPVGMFSCKSCGDKVHVTNTLFGTKQVKSDSNAKEKFSPGTALLEDSSKVETQYKSRWHNTIQFQVTFTLLLVITLVLGSLFIYNYQSAKKELRDELVGYSKNTTIQLAGYLADPLYRFELAQIEGALKAEMLEKRIYAIQVIDPSPMGSVIAKNRSDSVMFADLVDTKDHVVIVGQKRDNNWNVESSFDDIKGPFITENMDITYKDEVIGQLRLYVTDKFLKEELYRLTINQILITLILYSTIIIGVSLTLRRVLVRPLKELTKAADRISLGDLYFQIGIQPKGELGLLVDAIQRMQSGLAISLKRLGKKTKRS